MRGSLKVALCAGFFSLGLVSTANATLESRLGGLAYYDTVLDITWAADANINGSDTWARQLAWVSGLTIGGIGGWRLPSADVNGNNTVANCLGGGVSACADNEMGYLYWEEGITEAAPGVFTNVTSGFWTDTSFAPVPHLVWVFDFDDGTQGAGPNTNILSAWAVHSGDVGTTTVAAPGTIALMGLGLAGLLGFGRRQRRR